MQAHKCTQKKKPQQQKEQTHTDTQGTGLQSRRAPQKQQSCNLNGFNYSCFAQHTHSSTVQPMGGPIDPHMSFCGPQGRHRRGEKY